MLVSNRNLLVIADVLAVNKGFAQAHPEDGARARARPARGQPPAARPARPVHRHRRARPSSWTDAEARDELSHVHLVEPAGEPRLLRRHDRFRRLVRRHLPIVGARLWQPDQESRPTPARFMRHRRARRRCKARACSPDQKIAIAPIRTTSTQAALEGDPLLSKDIRFFFEPNSAVLDESAQAEPGLPRRHQALPAGEPGLDGAAARPRRQRPHRRVPPARAASSW